MKKSYPYLFPFLLVLSILLGGVTGLYLKPVTVYLKPIGLVFIRFILAALVPFIFFSVSSSVARLAGGKQFGKIILSMLASFLFTGIVAALYMLGVVALFPPAEGVSLPADMLMPKTTVNFSEQIANIFSTTDFFQLFSHQHLLPLIIFSILIGLTTSALGKGSEPFKQFLTTGADIFTRMISLIMLFAPLGFFAYFAVMVSELGKELFVNYFRITFIYYAAALVYFFIGFSFYACLADQRRGFQSFWRHIFLPFTTSLSTCSSAASIPANIEASKNMGVPAIIAETVIPIGAVLHKDGSVLGGILKIAFLFGLFHLDFSGLWQASAIPVALLVGMVMGAIPSGGMMGELLILSVYGFPPEALMMIAAIGLIIDPVATVLNVTGDTVCSMLVTRFYQVSPSYKSIAQQNDT